MRRMKYSFLSTGGTVRCIYNLSCEHNLYHTQSRRKALRHVLPQSKCISWLSLYYMESHYVIKTNTQCFHDSISESNFVELKHIRTSIPWIHTIFIMREPKTAAHHQSVRSQILLSACPNKFEGSAAFYFVKQGCIDLRSQPKSALIWSPGRTSRLPLPGQFRR